MRIEIDPLLRDTAARLGADAPYALKALAGQLADDPDMGRPSDLPGILTVTVDGGMFEDCPDLYVGYIREPDRIEIRYLEAVPSPEAPDGQGEEEEQGQGGRGEAPPVDPAGAAVAVRQIADAWYRISRRLRDHAPDSYAALRAGAGAAEIAALESALGVRIPVELRVLWMLTAGDDGSDGWGCLPGNMALMPLESVEAVHRLQTDVQTDLDVRNARLPEEERVVAWRPTWIPVVSLSPADTVYGLYLDAATGRLGWWSRFDEPPGEEVDTLVTYLEEAADALEAPELAAGDKPGLIGGTLVWLSSVRPDLEDRWEPLTG
ncbi:SMI1/KNR4 family protein [Streptomyces sp. NPDC006610]|uniref:SMI1/KNR4 family protein n=1 Tax=Streptomyces sp. NPDC006610 TaxID=3154584 RepID=UPI0033BA011E